MRLTGVSRRAPATDDGPPEGGPVERGGGIGRRAWFAFAAALLVLAVTAAVMVGSGDSPAPLDGAQAGKIAAGVVDKAIEKLKEAPADSALAYQAILPSLVRIDTRGAAKNGSGGGLGTGVIINAKGAILTAFHVIDGTASVRVSFVDGTRSPATITSTDPDNDIAVLQPERPPELIVPAVLGGGGQVGDAVFAVGHPLGYVGSLTSGVISGLGRTVEAPNGRTLRDLIQFDAAVNPGNSGGPLLNRAGQVIGIVTALANPSRDGYFIGIGFAVPIDTAGGAANAPSK